MFLETVFVTVDAVPGLVLAHASRLFNETSEQSLHRRYTGECTGGERRLTLTGPGEIYILICSGSESSRGDATRVKPRQRRSGSALQTCQVRRALCSHSEYIHKDVTPCTDICRSGLPHSIFLNMLLQFNRHLSYWRLFVGLPYRTWNNCIP